VEPKRTNGLGGPGGHHEGVAVPHWRQPGEVYTPGGVAHSRSLGCDKSD